MSLKLYALGLGLYVMLLVLFTIPTLLLTVATVLLAFVWFTFGAITTIMAYVIDLAVGMVMMAFNLAFGK